MLTVEVMLYAEEAGGRKAPITDIGYACACKVTPQDEAACECRINFYKTGKVQSFLEIQKYPRFPNPEKSVV